MDLQIMHISSCLHPKEITNPYTGKRQVVACGKCAACMNAKAAEWVKRLDQERYCWHYAYFFTLTYAPEHVPTLIHHNGIVSPSDLRHLGKDSPVPIIDINDLRSKCTKKEIGRLSHFLKTYHKY